MNTTSIRNIAWLAIAGATVACSSDFLSIGGRPEGQCGFMFDYHPCVDLAISPSSVMLLQGDTIRLSVFSDKSPFAPPPATWTVSGDAASFVDGNTLVKDVTTETWGILVKGVAPGYASVEAKSVSLGYSAQRTVTVADSASLVSLQIMNPASSSASVKQGSNLPLIAELKDAAGMSFPAGATWTTSDASVLSLHPAAGAIAHLHIGGHGNSVGSVDVIVAFRALRDTVRINVIP